MPRPPRPRRIARRPEVRSFKPAGHRARDLPLVQLGADELEALRLADLLGLYHETAAERMGISRVTFGRVVARARTKVAEALITGKLLLIGGGPVVEGHEDVDECPVHWGGRRRGRGCRCVHGLSIGMTENLRKEQRGPKASPGSPD